MSEALGKVARATAKAGQKADVTTSTPSAPADTIPRGDRRSEAKASAPGTKARRRKSKAKDAAPKGMGRMPKYDPYDRPKKKRKGKKKKAKKKTNTVGGHGYKRGSAKRKMAKKAEVQAKAEFQYQKQLEDFGE
jgi:hypothetical protein